MIFGSGFGLYGYLPALIESGEEVILQKRYRLKFEKRKDLLEFSNKILWTENDKEGLSLAKGVVIALNPAAQVTMLEKCLRYSNIECLILEKPIAESPKNAKRKLDELISSGKKYQVGYTFRYTEWSTDLSNFLKSLGKFDQVTVNWNFLAHHYQYNLKSWKREHSSGGGAIRFYGIHLVALLAKYGYNTVSYSTTLELENDDIYKWQALFEGNNLPRFQVNLDSKSSEKAFKIEAFSKSNKEGCIFIFNELDPFYSTNRDLKAHSKDYRIPLLRKLIHSLSKDGHNSSAINKSIVDLWEKVEKANIFKKFDNRKTI